MKYTRICKKCNHQQVRIKNIKLVQDTISSLFPKNAGVKNVFIEHPIFPFPKNDSVKSPLYKYKKISNNNNKEIDISLSNFTLSKNGNSNYAHTEPVITDFKK